MYTAQLLMPVQVTSRVQSWVSQNYDSQSNTWKVVAGECYMHRMIDGESLLGLLLPSWELSPAKTYKSLFRELMFLDRDTIITLRYDPKQGDLPLEWEATEQ